MAVIKALYEEHAGTLGYRMIAGTLRLQGTKISDNTVYSYMKQMSLKAIIMRKKPDYVYGKKHHIYDNHINRNFTASAPNQKWCTDFTYLKLRDGRKRYNCSVIDLFDRSIVATLNGKSITSNLAIDTIKIAIQRSKISDHLILHSDQGSQFASHEFSDFCKDNKIIQSMSKAGCPYDNAPMERFYNTYKNELINQYIFEDDTTLNQATENFVYAWYNQCRPHSYNKGLTPNMIRQSNY
jgi:transposase InsO family protein